MILNYLPLILFVVLFALAIFGSIKLLKRIDRALPDRER